MSQPAKRRNYWLLIVPILFAMVYRSWFYFWPTLTGYNNVDGLLGVLLGLYIGSRAAANMLDMLLYSRNVLFQNASTRSIVIWLTVNILTQIIGFMVILFALLRFFR
jgi:hypothetical protein